MHDFALLMELCRFDFGDKKSDVCHYSAWISALCSLSLITLVVDLSKLLLPLIRNYLYNLLKVAETCGFPL